ncbi:DUF3182 family protein [uncultured Pseudacidovorax sp.]|uniref:DUF3182 family protein n=1 Tax=uncultured Pseudacidovorax sp. TaxID=679313 RepID=UPI0025D91C16|nr:DUF3182 family protein [uncultured Pseudacidovorax sp.]
MPHLDSLAGLQLAALMPAPGAPPGQTWVWHVPGRGYDSAHERAARLDFARRLAALKGLRFSGDFDPHQPVAGPQYVVPNDTLTSVAEAQAAGIQGPHDLFGGVVPHPFVATKAITHPLVAGDAVQPDGWSHDFHAQCADAVLHGYTAFDLGDARRAGRLVLARGPVRLKPVRGTAGRGQTVAGDAEALDVQLEAIGAAAIAADGVVLEENLRHPDTVSVGQVIVGSLVLSYYGHQRLTRDNQGEAVYGGSALTLVRGGLDVLMDQPFLPDALRLAVAQARSYHAAVERSYAGFFASRINYDVAQGMDAHGQWRSGVLEQSWRLGGATSAEIAALERFHADPALQRLRAVSGECYGDEEPPAGAHIYYRDTDPVVGPITRYALILPDADPA